MIDKPKRSEKPLIICDLDNILNNLYPHWMNQLGIDHGIRIDIEQMREWEVHESLLNLHPDLSITQEQVHEYIERPGFFRYVPPMPGAIESLRRLQDQYNIVVYTACQNLPHAFGDKAAWIDYWLPFLGRNNKIIGGNHKFRVKAGVLIDDSPGTQVRYKREWPDAKVVSIRWPYNENNADLIDFMAWDYRDSESAWLEIENYLLNLDW